MHEYRRLVEGQMKAKRIEGYGAQAKLAAMAGVSRQVIHTILRDDRERLNQAPDEKTVNGLAKAFSLKPEVIWTAVAVSMGMPSYVVPTITHEVKAASDEDLLNELAGRLGVVATFRAEGAEAPSQDQKIDDQHEGVPTYDAEPHDVGALGQELTPPLAEEGASES